MMCKDFMKKLNRNFSNISNITTAYDKDYEK